MTPDDRIQSAEWIANALSVMPLCPATHGLARHIDAQRETIAALTSRAEAADRERDRLQVMCIENWTVIVHSCGVNRSGWYDCSVDSSAGDAAEELVRLGLWEQRPEGGELYRAVESAALCRDAEK
jgi:hypothetical protein